MMTEEISKLAKTTVKEEMLSGKIEGYCPEGLKLKMKLSIDLDKALIGLLDYRLLILGAIIVAVMMALPDGLMGIPEAVNRLIRQRASKAGKGKSLL